MARQNSDLPSNQTDRLYIHRDLLPCKTGLMLRLLRVLSFPSYSILSFSPLLAVGKLGPSATARRFETDLRTWQGCLRGSSVVRCQDRQASPTQCFRKYFGNYQRIVNTKSAIVQWHQKSIQRKCQESVYGDLFTRLREEPPKSPARNLQTPTDSNVASF